MRRHAPRKSCWRFGIASKLFLQTRGKPTSHLQALDRELKASYILRSLGRSQRMRRQAPRKSKFCCRFGIGSKPFFCRLVVSLRVICKR